jgi:phage terminase Nu1 subunit (DNA packaging protein)
MTLDLSKPCTQQAFGDLVGVGQSAVSDLVSRGILTAGEPVGQWLLAYCHRLREQAAGRLSGEVGGLDLVQERAALAREQRISYEIKNAVARGEYAPIELLSSTLAMASQAVADRLDALPGLLKKACPDLPAAARDQVESAVALARNEWSRGTAALVNAALAAEDDAEIDEEGAVEC